MSATEAGGLDPWGRITDLRVTCRCGRTHATYIERGERVRLDCPCGDKTVITYPLANG